MNRNTETTAQFNFSPILSIYYGIKEVKEFISIIIIEYPQSPLRAAKGVQILFCTVGSALSFSSARLVCQDVA